MLKAENLSKRFGEHWALEALNLEIAAGEIQCLLGANGTGKTTTLNLFLGFLKPTSGAAYVNGREVMKNTRAARADLAYVPEQVNLYPVLTGFENLLYFTKLAGHPVTDADSFRQLFDRVGLDRRVVHTRVEHYSKGMRQKVGLAIALARHAKALLLDEPLSGLDSKSAIEFCDLLLQLAADGASVLMVTHDLSRARETGHRVGIMKEGRLIENIATSAISHAELERIYLDHMRDAIRPAGGGL